MPKFNQRKTLVTVIAVLSLLAIVLSVSATQVGVASEICTGGLPLHAQDLSAVPPSVAEDANQLATELFGDNHEERDTFANQLLGTYQGAKDKDFILLFNSGGWGWNLIESSPGWLSIFTGIEYELHSSGYNSLLVSYQRTTDSLPGRIDELAEMLNGYSSKAKDLAYRVEFLTTHLPELKVIIAGESNGTIICDQTMGILADNPRVYSIQSGPPFWHDSVILDRTLIMTDNGRTPDSFTEGEILIMVRASLRNLLGLPEPPNESGAILHFIKAPGHDYWWQYPEVYRQITDFLELNFGIEKW